LKVRVLHSPKHVSARSPTMAPIQVKRLRPEASLPVRGSELAAGVDLSAAEAVIVPAGGKAIVKTGLAVAIPEGTYARLAPRSGLAAKKAIDVGAGVVDYDYRGEVGVILFNHGSEDFAVAQGDRIAQMILEKVDMCGCEEVEALSDTARGAGGFGSTGVSTGGYNTAPADESASKKTRVGGERIMQVKRLNPAASMPVRGSEHAAGFDLSASEAAEVPAGGKAIVKTGVSVAVPAGTYARIAPRSGLAAKKMLHCGAGVVDFDYRGEVGVVMFNYGKEAFTVAAGDRIAQMILEEVDMMGCMEVDSLDATARGAGGFGSTGVSGTTVASQIQGQAETAPKPEVMLVKRLQPDAALPVKGSEHAAGFDLSASEAVIVPPGGKAIVKTGLSVAAPQGTYARLAPRSGLAAKRMIHVGAGVVDADYRGEVGVILFNHGSEPFEVNKSDRVAQLILEKVALETCVEVDILDSTARGSGGFGSTGVADKVPEKVNADRVIEKCGA